MKKSLIPQYIQFVRNTFEDMSIGNIPYKILDLIDVNEPDCTVIKFLISPSKGRRDNQLYLIVYSFLQFKIQMLHYFTGYIQLMNQYPYFVHHKGIGVVNEMINIAIDTEESYTLKSCIDMQIIKENDLSKIILDWLKGWRIIQTNKIVYPGPYDTAFMVNVDTLQGKIGHLNPRNFSPSNKSKNQSKNFLKFLYETLLGQEIRTEYADEKIGNNMPIQFLFLFYMVQEQSMPDFVAYYEKEMLNNQKILEFYQNCLNRDIPQNKYLFNNSDFISQYYDQIIFQSPQLSPKERTPQETKIILENSSSLDKTQNVPFQIQSIFINSRFTNQEIFIQYYRYLNEGELLKAYHLIKQYEESNEVDSITYLALSNTLCKIVENKTLNDYIQSLNEEDLLQQIELEKNQKDQYPSDESSQQNRFWKYQSKQTQQQSKVQELNFWSSGEGEESNTSVQSVEVCSQDLLSQIKNLESAKKLTLKQYTQKIKQTYQQSINKNPYSVISYFNLSLEYYQAKQTDIIIDLLKKCLVIQNQDYEVLYQLSILYWNQQNYKLALKYFKKQLLIKNFDLHVCLNIYKSYQRLNKVCNAIYYFKKLELNYPQFQKSSQKLWMQIEADMILSDINTTLALT
ncbi:hypothetical protein TTHERM_00457100 (macronuclear) [Tetrahymena thermophila SB210]|uniref:Uncharacterized protein n=1 Tax=Tetrahymena thermophila (strain SB210) TaxID=312017 RepID=I7MI82_TETTS|nr:hypothetical protein TTHERM_00457100 [Tetrahymena thermophila SB210]EAS03971.2 hypothetical protein TTHERM_00457100 [Tetrahymena thermophila SB210]|eukprot:XP_001024216.2 hypothetical protein TTHERM_00457100 [Tetrahymena thermophila SB210]